ASEWQKTGIVEGSHLIMFYDEKGKYDLKAWLAKVENIAKKDEQVILICHSGVRSRQLANYLAKVVGYENVYNVKKGIVYWIKKSNPVVSVK
ncbi:MAG: rhodanese-like domain-containing protein, partial [Gammaproteobacteria bacterium]